MADPSINLNFEDPAPELDDDEKRKIDNFMEDLPTKVYFRRSTLYGRLWAFWCEPTTLSPCSASIRDSATHSPTTTTNQRISDNIKSVLVHLNIKLPVNGVLIQFWAPIKTETGCLQLVTSDQPFALTENLDEGLLKYRKHCLDYKFNVDAEEEQHLGIPGRVFRQKWQECTLDVRYYSTKDYPQRNFALTCNIFSSLVFPVFHTSIQECVGVLELVTTDVDLKRLSLLHAWCLKMELESAGLKTSFHWGCSDYRTTPSTQQRINIYEINEGLKVVCTTHSLPLALTWVPCGHSNAAAFDRYNTNDVSSKGQVLHIAEDAYHFFHWGCSDDEMGELIDFSFWNDLQKGQGVAGKAYLSHKLCFCRDITQFTLTQFPLLPIAHNLGLTVCFAICLQTSCTGNYDFILEFFLHPQKKYGEDPTTFLCSILQTMKQRFPSFKLPSGEELGKELSIEFIEPPMNQEPVPGVLHNGRDQNNVHVTCSDEARMNQEPHFSQCQTTISPPGLQFINSGQEMTQAHPPNQQQLPVQVDDNATLGSKSTLKCECREVVIKRWKSGKRNKDNGSTSRRDDPPYSNLPAEKPMASVPHMTPLATPTPVTVKATYGDDMIKFQLPFSPTMVELEEEVSKRLKLKAGTYKIKYTDDDGDMILIAWDKDLQDCVSASNSLGMDTIKMFIEPITKISPST